MGGLEIAGSENWASGSGPALLRPVVEVNGHPVDFGASGMAWERSNSWLPTFACRSGDLAIHGTLFCPVGRDADMPGLVYLLSLENRGGAAMELTCAMTGVLGSREVRVRSGRPVGDSHRVHQFQELVLLEGDTHPGLVTLALGGDGEVQVRTGDDASFELLRTLSLAPGQRADVAFYLTAAPERDGAASTAIAMRKRGWASLLGSTRQALESVEQETGVDWLDRLVNRNVCFAYFYGVGRALDDGHFYLVRSRAPWSSYGMTTRDWEALMWTLPAIQLVDAPLARELLLRAFEVHGYDPGRGVNYADGTMFTPGFSLEGLCSYPLALDRYIRDTGDDRILENLVVGDTLFSVAEQLESRKHGRFDLYSTDVEPDGESPEYPYTTHGNAVAASALDVLRRTLDEEYAFTLTDPESVRNAVLQHLVRRGAGGAEALVAAADLAGHQAGDRSPSGSLYWVSSFDLVGREDEIYRRTCRELAEAADPSAPRALVRELARLYGPDGEEVMRWLRRAPLDAGFAAEFVDAEGRMVSGGGDAALAGLLAYTVWYALNAMGIGGQP